jgi:hypothetical protein
VGGVEFGAKVEAQDFIDATLSGHNGLPLKEGIYLQVRMRIEERRDDTAWVVKSRTILEVLDHQTKPTQGSLPGAI